MSFVFLNGSYEICYVLFLEFLIFYFSIGFKGETKTDDDGMVDLGISYKKVVDKRENLANPINPAYLTKVVVKEKFLIDAKQFQL